MKAVMTFEEKALIWGMGFAHSTISSYIETYGYEHAQRIVAELIDSLSLREHAAAFKTAFGG